MASELLLPTFHPTDYRNAYQLNQHTPHSSLSSSDQNETEIRDPSQILSHQMALIMSDVWSRSSGTRGSQWRCGDVTSEIDPRGEVDKGGVSVRSGGIRDQVDPGSSGVSRICVKE